MDNFPTIETRQASEPDRLLIIRLEVTLAEAEALLRDAPNGRFQRYQAVIEKAIARHKAHLRVVDIDATKAGLDDERRELFQIAYGGD